MTRLILVRHGQSEANLRRVFAGHTDAPLTALGRAQAAATGEYLCRFPIDVAYASDLRRAYDTAAIIAARQGLSVTPDPAFREIFAGEWEGRLFAELATEYPHDFVTLWRGDIGNACPTGGESVLALGARISSAISRILAAHEGKTILIGTHATPIRVMECLWRGIPVASAAAVPFVKNASTTVVEYEGGVPRLLLCGYEAYLGTLATTMPVSV